MSSQFTTPVVTEMQVIPVAGHDSMLMNLSGAHAPFFTRNIVIICGVVINSGRSSCSLVEPASLVWRGVW